MTQPQEPSDSRIACPNCGAPDQQHGTKCQRCGRVVVRLPEWAQSRQRKGPFGWQGLFGRQGLIFMTDRKLMLLAIFVVVGGAFIWHNYHIVPNPITLLFKGPSTDMSSQSAVGEWAMDGYDLEHTRYVPKASAQPQGRLLWSTAENLLQGESRPAVVGGVVYVGSFHKFRAFKADTGEVLWQRDITGLIKSSPAVAGDMVYFGNTDKSVWALDRLTGETKWTYETDNYIISSPTIQNGLLFIGSGDKHLYALDAATGEYLWRYGTESILPNPPALHNGVLYFTADISLHSANYRTGQNRMRFRHRGASVFDAPAVANGLVYMISDWDVLAIRAGIREVPVRYQIERFWRILWIRGFPVPKPPTQQGFVWRFRADDPFFYIHSNPAITPDTFYVGDSSGRLYARNAKTAAEVWTFIADGPIKSSPVVVQDTVYFGTEAGSLYALDRHSGDQIWRLPLGSPIMLPQVFADGKLFVRTANGQLHAVE